MYPSLSNGPAPNGVHSQIYASNNPRHSVIDVHTIRMPLNDTETMSKGDYPEPPGAYPNVGNPPPYDDPAIYPGSAPVPGHIHAPGAPVPVLPPHVINVQPGAMPPPPPGAPVTFMQAPGPIPNCPPGLEYLTLIDKLFVNQHISLTEVLLNWEISNKYAIQNGSGQQVFYAFEESGCCERQCCGGYRGYTMHIVDNFQKEVIRATRPFKCCTCMWCASSGDCGSETTIEAPPGNVIGIVRQQSGCCSYNFVIRNPDETEDILRIEGMNMCGCSYACNCCADKVFEIFSAKDNKLIGAVKKKWRGCVQESFTDADLFSVEFPMDLDVRMKALLVGATFLIDFMAFEQPKNNQHNS